MMQKMLPVIQLSCAKENIVVAAFDKPSSLIHEIQLKKVGNCNLFKFSEHLQLRMEELLDKKKADRFMTDEIAELEAIAELDSIFTHMNVILAQLLKKCCS